MAEILLGNCQANINDKFVFIKTNDGIGLWLCGLPSYSRMTLFVIRAHNFPVNVVTKIKTQQVEYSLYALWGLDDVDTFPRLHKVGAFQNINFAFLALDKKIGSRSIYNWMETSWHIAYQWVQKCGLCDSDFSLKKFANLAGSSVRSWIEMECVNNFGLTDKFDLGVTYLVLGTKKKNTENGSNQYVVAIDRYGREIMVDQSRFEGSL